MLSAILFETAECLYKFFEIFVISGIILDLLKTRRIVKEIGEFSFLPAHKLKF